MELIILIIFFLALSQIVMANPPQNNTKSKNDTRSSNTQSPERMVQQKLKTIADLHQQDVISNLQADIQRDLQDKLGPDHEVNVTVRSHRKRW